MICRRCNERPAEFKHDGFYGDLCHECTHELGHLHNHGDDPHESLWGLTSDDHFYRLRVSKKILNIHLENYREAHPI